MSSSIEPNETPASAPGPAPVSPEISDRLQRSKVPDSVLEAILDALRGVKFGQVTVTVQDGHVVQIERLERRRFRA